MSQVRKHALTSKHTGINVPVGSRVLTVGSYLVPGSFDPEHAIWTEEPTDARVAPQRWLIDVLMTGDYNGPDMADAAEHIGSHIGVDGAGRPYVTHFYLRVLR